MVKVNGAAVRAVQRGRGAQWRAAGTWTATVLAGVLVLLALNLPGNPRQLEPGTFLRLPIEALVYLGVVLALPRSLGRVRTVLALTVGLLLGVTAVFRFLDLGFLAALDRPFDALVDWRYTESLVSLTRDSFGEGLGTVMLVAAAVAGVLLLVVLPLSLLRLTRVAARNRGPAARVLAGVTALWLALAVLDVQTSGEAVAAASTAPYVYGQFSRVPGELADQREFEAAAEEESTALISGLADRRGARDRGPLSGLRGKNVLIVFVESYGEVALEGSWFSPQVDKVLAEASQELGAAGFAGRSAWFTSPTFGGISWLAHATLQSGLWVDSQQRYDILMKSPRMTLSQYFGEAGWRTVAVAPSNNRDWPEGRQFYHWDKVYDSRNLGYEGPRFAYPTMPDQFTLAAFQRLELAADRRRPVMAEIDLLSSHTPWVKIPRMVKQSALGNGSVFNGMPDQLPSEEEVWSSPRRVQEAYGDSIEYSLTALTRFIRGSLDDDDVVVFLGDHQPTTIVTGEEASHDVPVTILARDQRVLDRVAHWGWDEGLRPTAAAPVWRMDEFRDRFIAAFDGGPARARTIAGSTP